MLSISVSYSCVHVLVLTHGHAVHVNIQTGMPHARASRPPLRAGSPWASAPWLQAEAGLPPGCKPKRGCRGSWEQADAVHTWLHATQHLVCVCRPSPPEVRDAIQRHPMPCPYVMPCDYTCIIITLALSHCCVVYFHRCTNSRGLRYSCNLAQKGTVQRLLPDWQETPRLPEFLATQIMH